MTDFNNNLHENEKFVDPLHKYTATVWKHYQFKTLKNKKGSWETEQSNVYCKSCQGKIKYSGNTTNLITHIRRHHSDLSLHDKTQKDGSGISSTAAAKPKQQKLPFANKPLPPNSKRSQAITTAIGKFIVKDLRPYSVVENEGFKALIKVM